MQRLIDPSAILWGGLATKGLKIDASLTLEHDSIGVILNAVKNLIKSSVVLFLDQKHKKSRLTKN